MHFKDKTELRRHMRSQVAQLSPAARSAASDVISGKVSSLPYWNEVRTVAAFAALPSEPNLQPLDWACTRTVLLPRIESEHLVFYSVQNAGQLQQGALGIMEPNPTQCVRTDLATADIIFVPGIAFTKSGARLGRGRGFYDRALSTSVTLATSLRIGICFHCQLIPSLPTESHDLPVHYVITEKD